MSFLLKKVGGVPQSNLMCLPYIFDLPTKVRSSVQFLGPGFDDITGEYYAKVASLAIAVYRSIWGESC